MQQFDDGASELRAAPACSERLSSRECQCADDSECGGAEWGPDFIKDGYCFLAYVQVPHDNSIIGKTYVGARLSSENLALTSNQKIYQGYLNGY